MYFQALTDMIRRTGNPGTSKLQTQSTAMLLSWRHTVTADFLLSQGFEALPGEMWTNVCLSHIGPWQLMAEAIPSKSTTATQRAYEGYTYGWGINYRSTGDSKAAGKAHSSMGDDSQRLRFLDPPLNPNLQAAGPFRKHSLSSNCDCVGK